MSEADPTPIPQASPGREYLSMKGEIDAAIASVLTSGRYILGREVEAFEAAFAEYLGARDAIGVASGTDAVELALRALGVARGDAVFTVSHTAVATVAAIERAGAVPVLLDVDDETFTLDPARLSEAIETADEMLPARPRAVVVVHLYGHPADMRSIVPVARNAGLLLVEDCAQAHGARLDGRRVGTFGDAAAFSFYPTKNVGALGDGGLVATDRPDVARRVRELRQYGWRDRYVSAIPGINSRLDELQGAVLRVRLAHLDERNARRREIAARYAEVLGGSTIRAPRVAVGADHAWHQYVARSERRSEVIAHLAAHGILTAIHYPVPVHLQPAYAGRVPVPGDLPVTERLAHEIVSLPMFPSLSDAEVDRVATALHEWDGTAGRPSAGP